MDIISTLVQRFSGNTNVKAWHVFQTNQSYCVVGATRMLALFINGRNLPTQLVAEAIEAAANDGDSITDDGASLAAALRALKTLKVPFRSRYLNTDRVTYRKNHYLKKVHWFKSTKSFEGKMVFLSDEQTYSEPHAVLIYREEGVHWFFDCAKPKIAGLYVITEDKALDFINASEETFVVSRG
jgi:hypothetical protein